MNLLFANESISAAYLITRFRGRGLGDVSPIFDLTFFQKVKRQSYKKYHHTYES